MGRNRKKVEGAEREPDEGLGSNVEKLKLIYGLDALETSRKNRKTEKEEVDKYWKGLKKYCLGFMGMSVEEYNNILYADLTAKLEGFLERQEYELDIVRNATFAIYRVEGTDVKSRAKTVDEFWPKGDSGKGNKDKKALLQTRLEIIKKAAQRRKELLAQQALKQEDENATKVTD